MINKHFYKDIVHFNKNLKNIEKFCFKLSYYYLLLLKKQYFI
jgi:hypothetical protein